MDETGTGAFPSSDPSRTTHPHRQDVGRVLVTPVARLCAALSDVSTNQLPRPHDDPSGHAPGPGNDRVLVVGAGPASGWGVTSHELALPGALARAVAHRRKRGCTVHLAGGPRLSAATATSALVAATPRSYDGVVLVLGVNDAMRLTSAAHWREHLETLLAAAVRETLPGTPIVVTGIQPMGSIPVVAPLVEPVTEAHAHSLNAITESLCDAHPSATFVPLPAAERDEGRYRSARQYDRWADVIAAPLARLLPETPGPAEVRFADSAEAEARRQRAVDRLRFDQTQDAPELRRILALAQQVFGTEAALLTVLDGDRQRYLATAGRSLPEIPRSTSICDTTIRTLDGLVVRDAREDPRFCGSPLVTSGQGVRFYAGVPLEAPTGERLGALCVMDSRPRPRQSDFVSTDFLLELALRAQRALWERNP
ncbi:GAF domain-containing protein [Curtobacterium sp. ISL-83]|uniref:GAF domain-containing protein n=1 Tax=Curtobacterium sp. ISL-83 TaxID=2819145 RepID=UPI001BEC80E6|nr:GAF domain-containing protein [Curtobacterium sp. ISL-83]MBT2502855.1 GAF domain-containing protein [Curtobacterium sp. ISL-83]